MAPPPTSPPACRPRRAAWSGVALLAAAAGWLAAEAAPAAVLSAPAAPPPAPEAPAVVAVPELGQPRFAGTGEWARTTVAEDQRRVADSVQVARQREAAVETRAASEQRARNLRAFLLPGLIGLALGSLVTWRWLCYLERRRLNRRGQAVHADPTTGLVLLHDPQRKPTTVTLRRDRRREREVAAAARALGAEDGPPDDAFAEADDAYEREVTDRIVAKHQESTRRRRTTPRVARPTGLIRRGFTLVEVLVAVAMLGTALIVLAGSLFTLDASHAANRELAKAQDIAQILGERIQGASWDSLGHVDQPWAWSRRKWQDPATPDDNRPDDDLQAAARPPLSEGAADLDDELVLPKLGVADPRLAAFAPAERTARLARCPALLREASGLDRVRVHVEFYALDLFAERTAGAWPADRRSAFNARRRLPQFRLPASPGRHTFAGSGIADGVVARILVTWTGKAGMPARHELMLVKRR